MGQLHEKVSSDSASQVDEEEKARSLHQRTRHSEGVIGEEESLYLFQTTSRHGNIKQS